MNYDTQIIIELTSDTINVTTIAFSLLTLVSAEQSDLALGSANSKLGPTRTLLNKFELNALK